VVVDDPAFVTCDALARPVNEMLRATTSLGRRVEDAAGPAALQQLTGGELPDVGTAIVTAAGALEARLLIHAVVMTREERVSAAGVRRAMTGVLQRASDWGLSRVAVMPFGLGAGNLDIDASAHAMLDAIHAWHPRAQSNTSLQLVFVAESAEEAVAFPARRDS
jgi:O-acetyl-ADP-ribose deacetylase (regulator of RNase III)